jgi:hypothetical protein
MSRSCTFLACSGKGLALDVRLENDREWRWFFWMRCAVTTLIERFVIQNKDLCQKVKLRIKL